MGGVPREQNMLKGHLHRVIYHQVYQYTKLKIAGNKGIAAQDFLGPKINKSLRKRAESERKHDFEADIRLLFPKPTRDFFWINKNKNGAVMPSVLPAVDRRAFAKTSGLRRTVGTSAPISVYYPSLVFINFEPRVEWCKSL